MSYWKLATEEDIYYNEDEELFEIFAGFDNDGNRYVEVPKNIILKIINDKEII